jgi:hypothetical protein
MSNNFNLIRSDYCEIFKVYLSFSSIINVPFCNLLSWDSSVNIVTGYGVGDRSSILYPLRPDRLWGPPSLLYDGYRGSFPGGKARPGGDADHSLRG